MNHPFNLNISDLEALDLDLLTDEEATQVEGGILPGGCYASTAAYGEEGGGVASTKAVGEEGGSYPDPVK